MRVADGKVRTLKPQAGPQHSFAATDADIAVYGGAAGGGKTWSLLIDPLRWVHLKAFRGVIFRRTYPQIMVSGGLWDESHEVYPLVGGKSVRGVSEWRFPSGATIAFRHLEHEKSKQGWQGSQVEYFGWDELTHFTAGQFFYVAMSRGRARTSVKPYVRASCNPEPGWVKEFLGPWVDRKFEGPKAESGEVRAFLRGRTGTIEWVPIGTEDSKTVTFIRARVQDNKILLKRNPEYVAGLKALLPVERARLLDGDWDVRREGLVYGGFEECIVERAPQPDEHAVLVGGIDFGFNNPFAAVWGHVDGDDVLWITGCRYKRATTLPDHSDALPRGPRWYADPAQPGDIMELRKADHDAVPCKHLGQRPVLSGIDRVSQRIATGRLKIVRGACLPLVDELARYHYDSEKLKEEPVKEDDHACDALRYLITGLDRGKAIFVPLPDPEPQPEPPERPTWEDDRWFPS